MLSEKAILRKEMKAALAQITPAQAEAAEKTVAAKLMSQGFWQNAACVLVFMAMKGECGCGAVIKAALAAKKAVWAPRIGGEGGGDTMRFYRVRSPDGPWELSGYGIREPLPTADAFEPARACGSILVLTPGLAFDACGGRLGRGKGFYDKFFATLDAAGAPFTACGLGFSCQLIAKVPTDPHDRRLDACITG
jgi:5-formyltetrahydrofolate cyclo-ligase